MNRDKILCDLSLMLKKVIMFQKNPVIDDDGAKHWYLNGLRHREDGPAIEWKDGTKEWYINGLLHREDGPAFIGSNGTKEWYKNGLLHREDGPAVFVIEKTALLSNGRMGIKSGI